MLVLTHGRANVEEIMPYHAVALKPMPVVEFFGRSRDEQPKCKTDESVFSGGRTALG